ncbi:roswell [Carabus blaptoides fortunei]
MFKVIRLNRNLLRLGETLLNCQKSHIKQFFTHSPAILTQVLTQNNFGINQFCTDSANNVKIPGLNDDVDVQHLTAGDPDTEKKLRIIILEADVMRQEGLRIPELTFMKTQHWQELLNKDSKSQRRRYLEFLWKTEKKRENTKAKKEQARIERENRPEYVHDGHIRYGLNHNTFLIRIYDTTINNLYNNRLVQAMQFGQKLVIDCGYDDNMTSRECMNCAKQLMLAFSENRIHDDPFDLHFCNVNNSKVTMQSLHRHIATLHEPWFPLHLHAASYMDVVPKDKLVYLTPHCREELKEYDHDTVYIVGAIVDKINQEPLSLAKAKREGLRMAKLPLDRYLQWGSGSGKSLTINQMVSILLDIKTTGDWDHALRHVPRRKVYTGAGVEHGSSRFALSYDRRPLSAGYTRDAYKPGHNQQWPSKNSQRMFDNLKNGGKSRNTKDFIKELMNN